MARRTPNGRREPSADDDAAGDGTASSPVDERRTTRFGALLRRTGLDELPQLFNVLRGEMSHRRSPAGALLETSRCSRIG